MSVLRDVYGILEVVEQFNLTRARKKGKALHGYHSQK